MQVSIVHVNNIHSRNEALRIDFLAKINFVKKCYALHILGGYIAYPLNA